MPKKGVWWSQDPRTSEWGQYAPDDNALIEASFQGKKEPVVLDFAGNKFTVDIKKMEQRNASGGSRKIKREEVEVKETAADKKAAVAAAASSASGTALVAHVKAAFTGGADVVTLTQLGALFEALGLDGGSAEPFVFFFHMQPAGCWTITAAELAAGLTAAGAPAKPTAADVKKLVATWVKQASASRDAFCEMYNWSFEFCRNSPSAATIPGEESAGFLGALLPLLPGKKFDFASLLDHVSKCPNVPRDLWRQIPKFLTDVSKDFSNYDDFFFHTTIDAFVESQKAKK